MIRVKGVDCPCCHGKGFLVQEVDQLYPDNPPHRYTCMHCEGKGALPHGPVSQDTRHHARRLKTKRQKLRKRHVVKRKNRRTHDHR